MNRAYLHTRGLKTAEAVLEALKAGRTVASNGPQLALQIDGHDIGDAIALSSGSRRLRYRAAMRSIAAMDHLEVVHNGKVIASHRFGKDRTRADFGGTLTVKNSGWILLRAWNENADPLVFDLYPYATTSPIFVSVDGSPPSSPEDAAYFVRWMNRVIDAAQARDDYNSDAEKQQTLEYLHAARAKFVEMGGR